MPNDTRERQLGSHHRPAVANVKAWLAGLPGDIRSLTTDELQPYFLRLPVCGWRLGVRFNDVTRRLDLLLTRDFPRVVPRVALVDRPKFLTWPHIEEDGVLCLFPESAEVDFTRPADVAAHAVAVACELIEDLAAGRRTDDFRTEFQSYWERRTTAGAPKLRSLLRLGPPSRVITVWRGRMYYLLGENENEISGWLGNRFHAGAVEPGTEAGLLLWLDRALLPQEYPTNANDVRRIVRASGGAALLEKLVDEGAERLIVAMAAPTSNGPCLAGVTVHPPAAPTRHSLPLTRGFRPGKMPRQLLVARYLGGTPVIRSTVERADAPWVHGRGEDPRFAKLHAAKVVVLGCGSVGAPVAMHLAAAGVGRLMLVDPNKLKWANVGRHPLGAPDVGKYKCSSLAEWIQASYPHCLGVDSLPCRWQDIDTDSLARLVDADLIVSAMGDWAAEGALNEWHVKNRKGIIVYGWTEAHACAGHAVAIRPDWGCLQCGFSASGLPLLHVSQWPQGEALRQEPACGAVYQPYGPVELGHVISVIAELGIDCLLGKVEKATHRIWAARRSLMESSGGSWTPEWEAIAGDRTQGGFVEEREWPRLPSCVECAAGAA